MTSSADSVTKPGGLLQYAKLYPFYSKGALPNKMHLEV